MDRALVDRIARSVLYEGYLLYPYRPSSMKNAQRWTFGTLYPESWVRAQNGSDRCTFQTEFLYEGPEDAPMSILGRFLIEGNETEVAMETLISQGCRRSLGDSELIYSSEALGGDTFKLNLTMRNTSGIQTTDTETVRRHALGSAHAIVSVSEGELVSMTDPPAYLEAAAGLCRNQGVWPVLIGANGERDTVLASPIILPDYSEVAPESAGDLSDATEIEEILTLRILTLTDDEKAEIRKAEDYGMRRTVVGSAFHRNRMTVDCDVVMCGI